MNYKVKCDKIKTLTLEYGEADRIEKAELEVAGQAIGVEVYNMKDGKQLTNMPELDTTTGELCNDRCELGVELEKNKCGGSDNPYILIGNPVYDPEHYHDQEMANGIMEMADRVEMLLKNISVSDKVEVDDEFMIRKS